MALGIRQQRLFLHRFDHYRPTQTIEPDGTPGEVTYDLIAQNQPAYFKINDEMSVPDISGRGINDIIFTLDELYVAQDYEISDGDYVVNKTAGDNKNGGMWIMRSQAEEHSDSGKRKSGSKRLRMSRVEANVGPVGVP